MSEVNHLRCSLEVGDRIPKRVYVRKKQSHRRRNERLLFSTLWPQTMRGVRFQRDPPVSRAARSDETNPSDPAAFDLPLPRRETGAGGVGLGLLRLTTHPSTNTHLHNITSRRRLLQSSDTKPLTALCIAQKCQFLSAPRSKQTPFSHLCDQ